MKTRSVISRQEKKASGEVTATRIEFELIFFFVGRIVDRQL